MPSSVTALIPVLLALAPQLSGLPLPRIEHFELTLPAGGGERRVIGAMRWIAREGSRGRRLEWEIVFPDERLRLLAVEDEEMGAPRLVWRELAPAAGRSLLVEGTRDGESLRVEEWVRGGGRASRCGLERGAVLPLHLIELLREGALSTGPVVVFDPLSRGLDTWNVRTAHRLREGMEVEHLAEMWRSDGTLAGRYRFEGRRLVRFSWQQGGIEGRPASAEAFARMVEEWARPAEAEEGASPEAAGSPPASEAPGSRAGRRRTLPARPRQPPAD